MSSSIPPIQPTPTPDALNRAYTLLSTTQRGGHWKLALVGLLLVVLSPIVDMHIPWEWREVRGFKLWWLVAGTGVLVILDSLSKFFRAKHGTALSFSDAGIALPNGRIIQWHELDQFYIYRQQFSAHGVPSEHARLRIHAGGRKYILLHLKLLGNMNAEAANAFETLALGISLRAQPHQLQAMQTQWGTGRGYAFGWRIEARREALRYRSLLGAWKTLRWHDVITPEPAVRNYWMFVDPCLAARIKAENGVERKVVLAAMNRTPNTHLLWRLIEQKGEI